MTPEELKLWRADTQAILNDPTHRWHEGAMGLLLAYTHGDDNTRQFVRTIAPYLFDEDGHPLSAKE